VKNILILTNSFSGGGAERSMNILSNELLKAGHNITLLAINSGPPDEVRLLCEGICLERGWKSGPFGTLLSLFRFQKVVRKVQPDVVVVNCSLPELFSTFLSTKIRFIVVEHAPLPWGKRKFLGKSVRWVLNKRQITWVKVTNNLNIWSLPQVESYFIPNPILFGETSIQTSQLNVKLKRLIYIGRLSEEKQPAVFLDLVDYFQIESLVIGDGGLRGALEEYALSRQLPVKFLGHQQEPWRKIEDGDLLIVPSAWEGDGVIVLEAVSRDIPMLISDIPSFRNFGLGESNYCKDPLKFRESIAAFQNSLELLIVSPAQSKICLEPRYPSKIAAQWEVILK